MSDQISIPVDAQQTPVAQVSDALVEAVYRVIQRRAEAGVYGFIIEEMPQSVFALLQKIEYPENAYVSFVGVPDVEAVIAKVQGRGWPVDGLGVGATHAVCIRNEAPVGSLKLVFVWREEERLHSLTQRGYNRIGPDEAVVALAEFAAERAPNEPQHRLWTVLGSGSLPFHLALDDLLGYYGAVYGPDAEALMAPRTALPLLGLLRDEQLLAKYATEDQIRRRLSENAELVERLQQGNKDDRQRALRAIENATGDEKTALQAAYASFTRLARGERDALKDLSLDDARKLISSTTGPKRMPGSPVTNDPQGDGDEEGGENGSKVVESIKTYESLDTAALELLLNGEHADNLTALSEQAQEALEKDEIEVQKLEAPGVTVEFQPDTRAVVLAREVLRKDRFGGWLKNPDESVDTLLKEVGRYRGQFTYFDSVRMGKLQDLLSKAGQLLPGFEGHSLLQQYLDAREALLPYLDLLSTSSLHCLLTQKDAQQAALRASEAYQRLLAHLDDQYVELRRKSADGTRQIYEEILAIDLIVFTGKDESIALVSPTHALVLWKYLELAKLIQNDGRDLSEEDRLLLYSEVETLPEPLLTVHVPYLEDDFELGFTGRRVGSFPLYRRTTIETSDVDANSIERAAAKLLALYPPVTQNLRILLLDPVSTKQASRAAKHLVRKQGIEHVTFMVARTKRLQNVGVVARDNALDELHAEGRVSLEEINVSSLDDLVSKRLSKQPVHLLIVSGEQERNVEIIEREGTRLHPLSIPHRLYADPLTGHVSLKPRSVQPEEGSERNPYGLYQSVLSGLSGNAHSERTLAEVRRVSLDMLRPLLRHTQFLIVAGIPEEEDDLELIRLAQGSGMNGDTVFTQYGQRIVDGIDALLRELNYEPSQEGIRKLLDRLEEVTGEGIFSTISEKGRRGFSDTALRGLLGLAVALDWYRARAKEAHHLVISTDSYLARQWLRKREDGRRTDLLGFRQAPDGTFHIDIIEVKSYEATSANAAENYPADQLRSVARVLVDILRKQGNVLTDRRRELLRRQIFMEGLLTKRAPSAEWTTLLNDVLDGKGTPTINLTLIELAFEQNIPATEQISFHSKPDDDVDRLPIRRLRLGEQAIQQHLSGLVHRSIQQEIAGPADVVPGETEAGSEEGEVEATGPSVVNPPLPEEAGSGAVESPEPQPVPVLEAVPPALADADAAPAGADLGFTPDVGERKAIQQMAKALYRALRDVGIQVAEAVDPELTDVGPSILRFKVQLRPDERLNTLQNRTRDLMRVLAAEKEPIIDNLPNTSYVYVDLPRPQRRVARFHPNLARQSRQDDGLYCPIGVTPGGEIEVLNIADLPHMLVAGSTGSGKTMFLYSLIMGLAAAYRPDEVELILIDPKQTDFVYFDDLPHLHSRRVLIDAEEAVATLRHLITDEMEARTTRLRDAKARDLRAYNTRHPEQPMRPIVVIIDEFADLADVMASGEREEFDNALKRLAQRARNVGIHLILATQRPTTDIINGTIKANLPCRISFRLASHIDSQTILDATGAEKLLGKGDMLLRWNGETKRLQGFFLPEDDLINLS